MDPRYSELSEQYGSKPERYFGWPREEMLPFIPKDSRRLLDVGCGGGAFGSVVKQGLPSCEVWGIEPDPEAAAKAELKIDRVINSTLSPDLEELEGERFDVVCFNDVLEHLADPAVTLNFCKQFLQPKGVVVASIPNILFFYQIVKILVQQDWKYEESGILDNTHLRFFTKKSIIRLFEDCGYDILKIEGINGWAGRKYKVANLLTLGRLTDWKFIQFAVVASPRRSTF